MLQVKKTLTLKYIENLFEERSLSTDNLTLQVPLNLSVKGFGTFPALLQFYNTWLRNNSNELIIPVKNRDEEMLKSFSQTYHGYYLLLMSWQKVRIKNEAEESIKYNFRPYTSKMFDLIDFLDTSLPKEDILLPCFDHFPVDKGLVNWLYYGSSDFPENEESLSSHLYRALQHPIRNYKTVVSSTIAKIFDDLTGIIWELMKNTHEWAKKDHLNQKLLSPGGRGVFIKFHKNIIKNLNHYSEKHKGLMEYYSRDEDLLNEQKYFLEVSVYDSGPGLVKRFLGEKWKKNMSIEEQVQIVKQCLTVHATSATGMDKDHKGAGLDRTLSVLDAMKGFLRIRSGDVALYRDLVATPYEKGAKSDQIELKDWTTCRSDTFTKMASAEGTLITLAFPLN